MNLKDFFSPMTELRSIVGVTAIVMLVFSLILRLSGISAFLPFYSLDENEITEFALGLFGPDKDPHWYKYGPLYWYVLKFVYWIQSIFYDGSTDQFVQQYFIDSKPYFLTSRYVGMVLHTILGIVAYFFCHRHLNKKAAPLALLIAIFPFSDTLTYYLPRIDTLLAVNVLLCLYFGLDILNRHKSTVWTFVLTGVFFGLSIASKPIPSLLILPSIGLIFFLRFVDKGWTFKDLLATVLDVFKEKGLYIFLATSVVAFYIGDPYAFKSFSLFWTEQVQAVQSEGSRNFVSGADLSRFIPAWGYLYLIAGTLAALYSCYDGLKRRKFALTIIGVYILVYWGLFALGASRTYFYVPVAPLLSMLIAYYIRRVVYSVGQARNMAPNIINMCSLAAALLIMIQPIYKETTSRFRIANVNMDTDHTVAAATKWVNDNIPSGSKILYYGYYTSLPKVIDPDINEYARYGDYFMYNRGQNKYWIEQYSNAFAEMVKGNTYDIVYQLDTGQEGNGYYTRYENDQISANVLSLAKQQGLDYVFTYYDITDASGAFNLVKEFNSDNTRFGTVVRIYAKQ